MLPATLRVGRLRLPLPALIFLTACGAGWHRVPLAPGPLPARQQAQVWRRGAAVQVHAVQLTTDSLFAIPYFRPIECDSCRLRVPTTQVDSLRLGSPVDGVWRTVFLVAGLCLLFLLIARPPIGG